MKIVHKIMVANFVNILLIALTGFFAYRSLDQVLTKLRFMEIADDLSSSFLEMRLAEKNYFLYGDTSALPEIERKTSAVFNAIEESRPDIVRAIGEGKTDRLESSLANYRQTLENARVGTRLCRDQSTGGRPKAGGIYALCHKHRKSRGSRIIADSRKGSFFLWLSSSLPPSASLTLCPSESSVLSNESKRRHTAYPKAISTKSNQHIPG